MCTVEMLTMLTFNIWRLNRASGRGSLLKHREEERKLSVDSAATVGLTEAVRCSFPPILLFQRSSVLHIFQILYSSSLCSSALLHSWRLAGAWQSSSRQLFHHVSSLSSPFWALATWRPYRTRSNSPSWIGKVSSRNHNVILNADLGSHVRLAKWLISQQR